MREATGSSMLLYLVVFFVGIIILFFAGIMTYSKAYKAKNRIIEVIEEYGDYNAKDSKGEKIVEKVVSSSLKNMGYQTGSCPKIDTKQIPNTSGYKYCITKIDAGDPKGGKYYKVTTYVHFDFPVIGNAINIPVSGQTKIIGQNYSNLN